MGSINERIIMLRKHLDLTQEKFAQKLNLTRTAISTIERGANNVTDRTISDICQKFNVNEDWLRTGDGEMFNPASSVDTELVEAVAEVVQSDNEFVKHAVLLCVKAMQHMSDTQQDDFIRLVRNMMASLPPEDEQ